MAEMKNDLPSTVRYVRVSREDLKDYTHRYVRSHLRHDLKRAGRHWPDLALQIWSSLHPDPNGRPARPIADIRRYVLALVARIQEGRFTPPPRVALVRRDAAREARRKATQAKREEIRRVEHVAAALARGEYPHFGSAQQRRQHG